MFDPQVRWITFIVAPIYMASALIVGVFWATTRVIDNVRWAIEERPPTVADQRNTFFAPFRLTRVLLFLWGVGTALLTTLYGLVDTNYIPKFLLGISFPGIVVSVSCHLFTEFALRPVAAQALEAGPPPVRLAPGIMGRTMVVWVLSYLTATPIRVVRAALNRVEQGDLDTNLVVFDGTDLGQLQRGFNSMVHGLRERERVRDLFGRHVGREVAALAEQEKPVLGGEERHAAVIFVDVIGSTQLVTTRPAVEVVDLLNRFFAVIVDEVDNHRGLVN
ncbi:adenylate/guanylate cyclase domain-containing protein, partial [Streptomyces salyersiae]